MNGREAKGGRTPAAGVGGGAAAAVALVLGMGMGMGAVAPSVDAQENEALTVTPQEMARALERPDAVVLHVGPEASWAAEHVPGARHVTHTELADPASRGRDAPLTLELPTPAALEATLGRLGVSDDSHVYVYWSDEWVSPATRVVFTLDWAGLGDRVHLLAGGLPAWKAAGLPTTDRVEPVRPGDLTLRPRPDRVVDAAWLQARLDAPGVRIVDARHAAAYVGDREDRGLAGHVPGAVNVTLSELVDDRARFRDPMALRALLRDAGVQPGDTVVAYCHIGQLASAVVFAARLAGHDVRLYDGSWQDWAARGLPAEGRR